MQGVALLIYVEACLGFHGKGMFFKHSVPSKGI